jgi:hypothetical protein
MIGLDYLLCTLNICMEETNLSIDRRQSQRIDTLFHLTLFACVSYRFEYVPPRPINSS